MKRNTLTTAVVAGLTGMAGMVSVSNAVNVSPDGTGQVLLYPYYSARGGNDTLISIVNSTDRGKAVKIRFREAVNSRDVLDFHIYMSAFDVWTAAVTATDDDGAKLVTNDTTCTVPYVFGDFDGEVDFRDFDYNVKEVKDGSTVTTPGTIDGGPTGIERTASGYIEVIEMATMQEHADRADAEDKTGLVFNGVVKDKGKYVSWAAKHTEGVPNNCDALVNAWTDGLSASEPLAGEWLNNNATTGFDSGPSGGLYGAASIINVADGTMFSYNATAIENFMSANDKHGEPGGEFPNLRNAGDISYSNVFYSEPSGTANTTFGEDGPETGDADNNPDVVNSYWTLKADEGALWTSADSGKFGDHLDSLLALNAALTVESITNEFTTDPGAGARTEWVVTMPTKKFHVDNGKSALFTSKTPKAPFTSAWGAKTASCDTMSLTYYGREEEQVAAGAKPPIFSPADPAEAEPSFKLCREANVIRFASDDSYPDATEILKEPKRSGPFGYRNVEVSQAEGWATLDMSGRTSVPADRVSPGPETNSDDQKNVYKGLPVIGFAVSTYTNGNIGDGVLSNYGGTFAHRSTRKIVSSG